MKNKKVEILFFTIFLVVISFIFLPLIFLIVRGSQRLELVLVDKSLLSSIYLSIKTSIFSAIIVLIFSLPVAHYLSEKKKLKQNLIRLLCIPIALPHLVLGIALLIFYGRFGIGEILGKYLGIDFIFTIKGIVLAQIFVNVPFALKFLISVFETVNKKLIFVGRNLGCTPFQAFLYVVYPAIKNQIISLFFIVWARCLGEFGAVIMVAGVTRNKTEVIPTSIFLSISTGDIDSALAISIVLILISLICVAILDFILKGKEKIDVES